MKRLNVLFLENEVYFNNLGVFLNSELFKVTCNGISILKKSCDAIEGYDLVVSMLYNNPLSNYYIYKAKEKFIPTLLVSDGIIEWENMFSNASLKHYNVKLFHPILHDYFFCVGSNEVFYFEQRGVNTIQFIPRRMLDMNKSIEMAGNKKFLITTANTAYYSNSEMERLICLMSSLQDQLDRSDINYIYRVFDQKLIESLSIAMEDNYTDGSFTDVLAKVDCVITTPSSIVIEAMKHGRPVGQLIYRDSPVFLQSGWNISASVDLEGCLASMVSRDRERMNFQSIEVEKYLLNAGADSVDTNFLSKLEKFNPQDISKFVDQNHLNLLNSKFNFNIEYFLRKIYLRAKKNNFFKYIRKTIR